MWAKTTVSKIIQCLQDHLLYLILIAAVTYLVWNPILSQTPNSEGFSYFAESNSINLNLTMFSSKTLLEEYSFMAKLYFALIMPIFRDNIAAYMVCQLVVMLLVYQTFYLVLVKTTRDKILSFTATVFFIANYVGSLTMLGIGNYQRFVQRVPNLIPAFISFYFLVLYLEKRKVVHLILLFISFTISIILSHFNVFLLPIFIIYPFIYLVITHKWKLTPRILFLCLFFILSTILLTRKDSLSRPNDSIFTFIRNTPNLTEMVLYQISAISFPQEVTKYLAKHSSPPVPYPYLATQKYIGILMLALFGLVYFRGKFKLQTTSLFLTFLLSLFPLCLMIIYAYDTTPNPLKFLGEDRIYFLHSIFIALLWAVLVKFFLGKNKLVYKAATFLIIAAYLWHNIPLIRTWMNGYQYRCNMYRAFINYIKNYSSTFNEQTVIVSPPDLIRSTDNFIRRFYRLDKATFITFEDNWRNQVAETKADKKDVFLIDYRYSRDANNTIDPQTIEIVNRSEELRLGKKVEPYPH